MAYREALEQRIEEVVLSWDGLEKKKMFGGVCYLVDGSMCFGIIKDYLIVRMAADLAAKKLSGRHVRPFDMTGRPMKGWVMVEEGSWKNTDELAEWLEIGRSFALTVPKKHKKKKSLEEIYYRNRS